MLYDKCKQNSGKATCADEVGRYSGVLSIPRHIKILLGIDNDDSDTLLMIIIDECTDRVVNYCRRDDFPDGLVSLLPIMAHRAYIVGGYGKTEQTGAITQVKQGDRTVTYESVANANGEWFDEFTARLEPYRHRNGKLPSECV